MRICGTGLAKTNGIGRCALWSAIFTSTIWMKSFTSCGKGRSLYLTPTRYDVSWLAKQSNCHHQQERVHGLGSSVGAGRFVDAWQPVNGTERRPSGGPTNARRSPACPAFDEPVGNLFLPLPGANVGQCHPTAGPRRRPFRVSRECNNRFSNLFFIRQT